MSNFLLIFYDLQSNAEKRNCQIAEKVLRNYFSRQTDLLGYEECMRMFIVCYFIYFHLYLYSEKAIDFIATKLDSYMNMCRRKTDLLQWFTAAEIGNMQAEDVLQQQAEVEGMMYTRPAGFRAVTPKPAKKNTKREVRSLLPSGHVQRLQYVFLMYFFSLFLFIIYLNEDGLRKNWMNAIKSYLLKTIMLVIKQVINLF